jgi:hypothetical protein
MMQIFRPPVHERGFFAPAGPAAPAIALATTVTGTGLSIASQAQQANAQAGMAGYQAQLARNRQMIADWQAQRAEQQGKVDEQQQRSKTASVAGAQRAALATQGGDVNSGSPLDIVGDTARAGEFDAQTIRSNAGLKAFGLRRQATDDGADAGLYDFRAANAMAGLPFGIGSSLLGGARSVADKWSAIFG